MLRRTFDFISLLLLLVVLAACGNDITGPPSVAMVLVLPESSQLTVGETVRLFAVARGADGNALARREVSWASFSSDVASVDQTGLVTALKEGGTTIQVVCEGKVGQATVTVLPAPVEDPDEEGIPPAR